MPSQGHGMAHGFFVFYIAIALSNLIRPNRDVGCLATGAPSMLDCIIFEFLIYISFSL